MSAEAALFLVPAVLLAAVGNLLLRRGMRSLTGGGRSATLLETALHALRSASVWIGMISYMAAMGFWLQVLGRAEIGLAYPIFSGAATLGIMAGAVVLLREPLERRRVIGALLMILGITIASLE